MNKKMSFVVVLSLCAGLAIARTQELTVWRGETLAVPLDDTIVECPKSDVFGLRVGSAYPVDYLTKIDGTQYAKALDRVVWDDVSGAHRWLEITAPETVRPGLYDLGRVRVKVLDRILPKSSEWKYFLDLWQHPWAVSRYFGVKPFSPEHYAKMRPLWQLLSTAGQKTLTVSLLEEPWDHQCHDAYHPMIRRVRHADGSWTFDYTLFDEYVAFGRSCGIGRDIHCYTMCPWGYRVSWLDDAGVLHREEAKPGSELFRAYWGPFLADFRRHLVEKGWFDRTYISMDERDPDDLRIIVRFIQEKAPGMKTSMAGNRKPSDFEGLVFDNYCQALSKATPAFLEKEVPARRAKGHITTCYVCCGPDYPNTFMRSSPDEAFWLGAYPAMAGLDGFLRWAWNSWPKDPLADASFGHWTAGDTFLVYPDGSPSVRFLELRNGIVAAEKIRLLKEAPGFDASGFERVRAWYNREEALANRTKFNRAKARTLEFVNAERSSLLVLHMDFNTIQRTKSAVVSLLREASAMGYNAVLWEVEDKVRWDLPEIAAPDAFTKDEFREILAEADRLGLEPIPLFQVFGHGEYILTKQPYVSLRENPKEPDCYCVSKPEVFEFQKKMLDEYLDLFGSRVRHFHLGADEAYGFAKCETCRKRDRMELYVEHLNRISDHLAKRGIRPGVWHDMITGGAWWQEGSVADSSKVPRKYVVWLWDYLVGTECDGPRYADKLGELLKLGFDVILAGATSSFNDGPFLPAFRQHRQNLAFCAAAARERNLLGLAVTSWSIRQNLRATQMPLFRFAAKRYLDPAAEAVLDWKTALGREKDLAVEPEVLDVASAWGENLTRFDGRAFTLYKDGSKPTPADFRKLVAEKRATGKIPSDAKVRPIAAALEAASAKSAGVWKDAFDLELETLRAAEAGVNLKPAVPLDRAKALKHLSREQSPRSAADSLKIIWGFYE